MPALLAWLGSESVLSFARKGGVIAGFFILLQALKHGLEAIIVAAELSPPAALLEVAAVFVPTGFAYWLDLWLFLIALWGAVKLATYVATMTR